MIHVQTTCTHSELTMSGVSTVNYVYQQVINTRMLAMQPRYLGHNNHGISKVEASISYCVLLMIIWREKFH